MSSMGNFFHWWATTVISYVLIMWWATYVINGQLFHSFRWATTVISYVINYVVGGQLFHVISYVINYVVGHLCHQWATSFIGGPLLSLVMSLIMWWATYVINGQLLSLVGHYCH